MSALIAISMDRTIQALIEAGKFESVKVIVGGALVNQDFADQIEPDGYAPNAVAAADLAKKLVSPN